MRARLGSAPAQRTAQRTTSRRDRAGQRPDLAMGRASGRRLSGDYPIFSYVFRGRHTLYRNVERPHTVGASRATAGDDSDQRGNRDRGPIVSGGAGRYEPGRRVGWPRYRGGPARQRGSPPAGGSSALRKQTRNPSGARLKATQQRRISRIGGRSQGCIGPQHEFLASLWAGCYVVPVFIEGHPVEGRVRARRRKANGRRRCKADKRPR